MASNSLRVNWEQDREATQAQNLRRKSANQVIRPDKSLPPVYQWDQDQEVLPAKRSQVKLERKVQYPTKKTQKNRQRKLNLSSVLWFILACLLLRLFFMERGVWDYYQMETILAQKAQDFNRIQDENLQLTKEIKRIKTDASYQRYLAKEHLGVIGAKEFVILFAKNQEETPTSENLPL